MRNKKIKIGIVTNAVILILIATSFQSIATTPHAQTDSIDITIYNLNENTVRHNTIEFDEFMSFFEPMNNQDEKNIQGYMQSRINILLENNLISEEEKELLQQQLKLTFLPQSVSGIEPKGIFFDLLNVFNGFGFAIKGEKIRSFLELPIMQFPFLNNTITALFSGFNSFEGNGFVFTLGTNGFRFIYNYDRDDFAFPYFSSVKGWFIGYTGILLEITISDTFGEEYEGNYIIGIGMNVVTLWSEN
ncbi:MAG: hypothetical protein QCI00_00990 [Candidatus Thermoplasmatota archaeon]|nr:hypothetical protein [Candidatus Thermoplasmatota archaeon]